jgi:hypothetical protein
VIDDWVKGRKGELDGFNNFAHARTPLLAAVTHIQEAVAYTGHAFNVGSLWAIADEYARQSVKACFSIGIALNECLPDEGAWSVEQRRLLADWRSYQEPEPKPPLG